MRHASLHVPFIFLGAATVVALFFQNCSNAHLEAVEDPSIMVLSSLDLKANACPKTRVKEAQKSKFIFMVDMSVSNIGNWESDPAPGGGFYSYFVPSKNTDRTGTRFDRISDFISSCGSSSDNIYSVIGFSNTAGIYKIVNGKKTLVCEDKFVNNSTAKSQLTSLKNAQQADIPWYDQWQRPHFLASSDYPQISGNTSYSLAFDCLEQLVIGDLTNTAASDADNYKVFFVTDGDPNDGYDKGCEKRSLYPNAQASKECYLDIIKNKVSYIRQAGIFKNKSLDMYALYYNQTGTPLAGTKAEEYIRQVATEGGTANPIEIGSFANSSSNAFCDIANQVQQVEFRPDQLMAVNLTTVRRDGGLKVDSDMDGLTDDEESIYGSDPNNPRSQVGGVLDGVCKRLGGLDACQTEKNKYPTCDQSPVNMGLSDCDVKVLGLNKYYPHPTHGVDTDKDGLPDFIEILKGTDPTVADSGKDMDLDGITNGLEILRGSDPFQSDRNLPSSELAVVRTAFDASYTQDPACPFGSWQLKIERMPGALSKAMSYPAYSRLSHQVDENVIMLFYKEDPRNSTSDPASFWFATTKMKVAIKSVSTNDFEMSTIAELNNILPSDFILGGEVLP